MISKDDWDELAEKFDSRYVKREDCDDFRNDVTEKLHTNDKRLAVIDYQIKINNWLTAAIAGGIITLVIKSFMGG